MKGFSLKQVSIFLAVLLVSTVASAGDGQIRRVDRPVADSYTVVLKKGTDARALSNELASAAGGKAIHVFNTVFPGFSFRGKEAAAMGISRNPHVEYVQEDSAITLDAIQSQPGWGLDRVDQRDLPLDDAYHYGSTATGAVIYVIDSGVNAVQELNGRIRESRNFAPDSEGVVDPNATEDCANHGTAVAVIAAGATWGVAKTATIVNYRVLNCANQFNSSSSVIAAIDWMISDHQVRWSEYAVANMSFGTSAGTNDTLDAAVIRAVENGITVVTSAGNQNVNACNRSPARTGNSNYYPNPAALSVITVGATSSSDARALFPNGSRSNWGPCLDVFAPGRDVKSSNSSGGIYADFWGTSFAAPYVAGVAAKHMVYAQLLNSPSAVEGLIKDYGTTNRLTNLGTGSPNLLLYSVIPKQRACCS